MPKRASLRAKDDQRLIDREVEATKELRKRTAASRDTGADARSSAKR